MSKLPLVLQNLALPVIGSPMFIVSNPQLVVEQCKAGVVGSLPALNARPAAQLDADGLVAVAAGACGHAGIKSPLALSGSIANGGANLAAHAMGADFAYWGLRSHKRLRRLGRVFGVAARASVRSMKWRLPLRWLRAWRASTEPREIACGRP